MKMSEFNSKNIEEFSGIWVFCEVKDGKLIAADSELISEARRLADDKSDTVTGLILGNNVSGLANELGGYGADKVIVCESPLLEEYTTESYSKVVCDIVEERKPDIFLFAATDLGRDLAPHCAARLHTGLTADCTSLDVDTAKYLDYLSKNSNLDTDPENYDMEDKNLKMTLPAFGGHMLATITCPNFRPQMSTVRPGIIVPGEYDEARAQAAEVEHIVPALSGDDIKVRVLETIREVKETVDLEGADVIVSVGFGISKDPKMGLALAGELADALGGVVAASRAAVNAGWISHDRMIGQTGKIVRPKIYIALGISGAIQHNTGMSDSDCIIAVNIAENVPIFEIADYGIVGDLFEVVPLMIEAAKAANG